MKNPPRVSGEVRKSHAGLKLASKATVIRDLGSENHLIDGDILEICKVG
jgi:hypothetical protein